MSNETMENVATIAVESVKSKKDLKGAAIATFGFATGVALTVGVPCGIKAIKKKINSKKNKPNKVETKPDAEVKAEE